MDYKYSRIFKELVKTFVRKYIQFFLMLGFLLGTFSFAQKEYRFQTKTGTVKATSMIVGLKNPWSMVWLPRSQDKNFSQGLITERNGSLILFNLTTRKKVKVKLPPDLSVYQSGQGGLLDLALDPDFPMNGWIYITFSTRKGLKTTTALARFRLLHQKIIDFKVLFEASPTVLGGYHFGSRLAFSGKLSQPRGLFMTVGERNARELAQDRNTHVGKVLRFNYTKNFKPEVYSYGHRNPQGLTWDPVAKRLLEHEHGARGGDEINIIEQGKNYGWPVISYGRNYSGSKIGEGVSKLGMEQPMYYWDPSIAPSGFVVYQGNEFPDWDGNLLVGSLKFGLLVRLKLNSSRDQVIEEERILDNQLGRVRHIALNSQGEIFLLIDSHAGRLYKITSL